MERSELIKQYIKKRKEHDKLEERLRLSRLQKLELIKEFDKTEDQLKAIQSAGMLIGEIGYCQTQ